MFLRLGGMFFIRPRTDPPSAVQWRTALSCPMRWLSVTGPRQTKMAAGHMSSCNFFAWVQERRLTQKNVLLHWRPKEKVDFYHLWCFSLWCEIIGAAYKQNYNTRSKWVISAAFSLRTAVPPHPWNLRVWHVVSQLSVAVTTQRLTGPSLDHQTVNTQY